MDTLTWTTDGATNCVASGGWSGTQPTSGSIQVGPITKQTSYTLTCQGLGGTVSNSVTVGISSTLPPVGPIATLAPGVVVYPDSGLVLGASASTGLTPGGVIAPGTVLIFYCCPALSIGQIFVMQGVAFKVTNTLVAGGDPADFPPYFTSMPVENVSVAAPALDEVFDKIDITGNYTLDASQMVSQSTAARTQSSKRMQLSLTSRPAAAATIPLAFSFVQGPLNLQGNATVSLQATPTIHYSRDTGFTNSSIIYSTSAQATTSISSTTMADQPAMFQIARFSIPIPLTVIDAQSNLVGVMAASIDVPVSAIGEPSTSYAAGYTTTLQQSAGTTVAIAGNGALTTAANSGGGANTLTLSALTATPDSNTPTSATYGDSVFAAIDLNPSLQLLGTVNLTNVDAQIGARYTGELTVLAAGSSPAYCGGAIGDLDFRTMASLSTSQNVFISPQQPPLLSVLDSLGPQAIGSFCGTLPIVTAAPQRAAALLSPLTIGVSVVASPGGAGSALPAPTGVVTVSLDGVGCSAAINSMGTGSCSLTPATPGSRSLAFQYEGDANYPPSVVISQGLPVPLALDEVTLAVTPNPASPASTFTFNFFVSPSPPNGQAPLPTGSVTIEGGVPQVCTAVLDGTGRGSCSAPYQVPGDGQLSWTAAYSGDANYRAASSQPATVTVLQLQILGGGQTITVGAAVSLVPQAVAILNGNNVVTPPTPPNLAWTTSNPTVATVTAAGTVSGIAAGTTTITVTDPVSLATGSIPITVAAANP